MIAAADSISSTPKDLPKKASPIPWIDAALLIGCGYVAFAPVSVTWANEANYSFGWWIPFVSMFLFFERWPTRPPRAPGTFSKVLIPLLALWAALLLGLRLAGEADPNWRPGLWIITSLYIAALFAWLWLYGGKGWVRHFAFPVGFLLLSLPWFFEIELPLVLGLMQGNTALVAIGLQIFGIDAQSSGNIIQLPNCRLGVEEACSGILSLQASLMLGFLLGEIYRLSLGRRLVLVLITPLFALVGNIGRTFFLGIVAYHYGVERVTAWHDTAGFSILVFTGLAGWLACLALRDPARPVPTPTDPALFASEPKGSSAARNLALALFAIAAVIEIVTQVWFGLRELSLEKHPQWTAAMPQAPGYKPIHLPETTRTILHADSFRGGSWQDARNWDWTVFWLDYKPKASNRVVLGWHTPDHCLPSVGLTKVADHPDFVAEVNGIRLDVQPAIFMKDQTPIYLFWLLYPTSGELPKVIENHPGQGIAAKFHAHFDDVLKGNRGVGVETLEVVIVGPGSYEAARSAFLDEMKKIVQPLAPR